MSELGRRRFLVGGAALAATVAAARKAGLAAGHGPVRREVFFGTRRWRRYG